MKDKDSLWGFFAHAGIIVGALFVAFFAIDRWNPSAQFLTSSLSKWLILLLAVCAIGNGVFSAVLLFQRQQKREKRRLEAHTYAGQRGGEPVYPQREPHAHR